ncbi:metallophosphoesterase family protein [Bradyrhizobium sp. CAR08]
MDRSFVIVQISDLHLDGSGRLLATIETLNAAIRERMADFADVPDRILLITGDIVDDPAPPALDEAIAVIASFRQTGLFTDIQAIAGNHDVKRPSQRAGRHDVYDYLHLPRTSKSVYYRQAGLDLVLLDSNRASLTTLVSGNVDQSAYSAMVSDSARLSVKLAGSLGSGGRADYAEPVENLVRVLALHHHPLPQATGEGKRFLGVPDEPLMYLAAPATFLEAATSLNVDLVLHGHRHVEGLTRYSIPDPRATSSESAEAFWRTIYVLSCRHRPGRPVTMPASTSSISARCPTRCPMAAAQSIASRSPATHVRARMVSSGRSIPTCRTASSDCRPDGIFPEIRPSNRASRSTHAPR